MHIFFHDWVQPYAFSDVIRSENGQEFVSTLFRLLCAYSRVTNWTTTAFRPHTNVKDKRNSKTLQSQLSRYFANDHKKWDIMVHLLIYVNKDQIHHTNGETPSSLMPFKHPSRSVAVVRPSSSPVNAASATNSRGLHENILHQVAALYDKASNTLTK